MWPRSGERYDATGRDVDPALAEALVWAALGERPPAPDDAAALVARTVLLLGLLEDEGLTDSKVDEILAAAAHAVDDSAQGAECRQVHPSRPIAGEREINTSSWKSGYPAGTDTPTLLIPS
ncbi:hypothetical protein O7634_00555 [Micromonospora sp. WMMD1120]|uniref:hypothetical protein n=1 Tax=Micromonospora sp. WMMD1120 TaxID=3016106 RepID=UPI0024176281|nr:hypothetical protein [Micromonospora sp. WMMD1120]MDG4805247.1 hypothetical protein [Micromonospora sp. WMMD1120]